MQVAMSATTSETTLSESITYASEIPDVSKAEARELALVEVQRVINLLKRLEGDDWQRATDCTEWTVRDIAAHLSGACRGWADWKHFRRQYIFNPYSRKGEDKVHGINRCEVADRADWSTDQIIAEMRDYGEKAINRRQQIPSIIRNIKAPLPPLGKVHIRYLLDTIYLRDQWMHRGDICRATGKQMFFTKEYDERITDLVMLDIAQRLRDVLHGTVDVRVTGGVQKTYRFGDKSEPDTIITIDLLELNRLASQRSTPEEALQVATITGDQSLANAFLDNCEAGY